MKLKDEIIEKEGEVDQERRKALSKLGLVASAVYATPVLMTLSSSASAQGVEPSVTEPTVPSEPSEPSEPSSRASRVSRVSRVDRVSRVGRASRAYPKSRPVKNWRYQL
jgi:hypothetical protein